MARVMLSPCENSFEDPEPEEAAVITVRVNVGPVAAPAELGLSHRAYVEAWRSPVDDTGAHIRLDHAGNRASLLSSMVKLVNRLGRRV